MNSGYPRLRVPTSEQADETFTAAKQGKPQTEVQLKGTAGTTGGQGAAKRSNLLSLRDGGDSGLLLCYKVLA